MITEEFQSEKYDHQGELLLSLSADDPHILSGYRSTKPNPKILDSLLGFVKGGEA